MHAPATQGLYAAKPWFTRRLARVEDALAARAVSPDAVTVAGVLASAAAGVCLAAGAAGAPVLWLAVAPLGMLRLGANALDGALARRQDAGTGRGALVNEAGDRLADVVVFAGLAAVAGPALAGAALAAALLGSLAGVLALALTGRRDCGGPLGKSERIVVLGAAAAAAALTGSPEPLSLAAWVLLGGSLVTAALRVRRLDHALAAGGAR